MRERVTPRHAGGLAGYNSDASTGGGRRSGYASAAGRDSDGLPGGGASAVAAAAASPKGYHGHGSSHGHAHSPSGTFYLLLLVCGIAGMLHVGLTVLTACSAPALVGEPPTGGDGSLAAALAAGGGKPPPAGASWWRTAGRVSGAGWASKLKAVGGVGVRGATAAAGDSAAGDDAAAGDDPLLSLLASDPRYVAALARSLHGLMVEESARTTPPGVLALKLAGALEGHIAAVGKLVAPEGGGGKHGPSAAAAAAAQEFGAEPSLPRYWEEAAAAEAEAPLAADDVEAAVLASLGAYALDLGDGRLVDGRYSHQTCYLGGDEAETCVYDGVLCTDGSSPVLVMADAPEGALHAAARRAQAGEGGDAPAGMQTAAGAAEALGVGDPHSDCLDYRYNEPSAWRYSSCRYDRSGDRPYAAALAERDGVAVPADRAALLASLRPETDYPLDLRNRWWGPINRRDVLVRPLRAEHVWPDVAKGWDGVLAARGPARDANGGSAPTHPAAPDVALAARALPSASGRFTVDWLDPDANGALWLVPGATQMANNPFFWMATGVGALFGARRSNASVCDAGGTSLECLSPLGGAEPLDAREFHDKGAPQEGPARQRRRLASAAAASHGGPGAAPSRSWGSHPMDGWVHPPGRGWEYAGQGRSLFRAPSLSNNGFDARSTAATTARWVVGPQWGPLPPQDVVLFTGWGGVQTASRAGLGSWYEGTLGLAAQPGARVYFNDLRSQYNASHLLCARRGAVVGAKPRIFASAADAWMWRQYAYMATGLAQRGVLTQAMYPPRRIVIIERKGQSGRAILNAADVLAAAAATGLPVKVVPRMDYLSFGEQVELMAGTGILIAPHGAALMNAMFLPAHAVVVELFPPLLRNGVFGRLAGLMGQLYYPIHSRTALPPSFSHMQGPAIMGTPEFAAACTALNMSSPDAFLSRWCNQASKTHPVVVPLRVLRRVLADAVDAIGAFSLLNPEWKAAAEAAGLPPPTQLAMLAGDPDVELTADYNASLAREAEVAARTTPVPVR